MNKWGCKWDANQAELITKSDDYYRIAFETPWSPPELFCIALSKMYPKLIFRLAFAEQGCNFYGIIRYQGEDDVAVTEDYGSPEDGFWVDPHDDDSPLKSEVEDFLYAHNLNPGG